MGSKKLYKLVTPTGFEPVTPRLGIWCSIHLSYGAVPRNSLAHLFTSLEQRLARGRVPALLPWLFAGSEANAELGALAKS